MKPKQYSQSIKLCFQATLMLLIRDTIEYAGHSDGRITQAEDLGLYLSSSPNILHDLKNVASFRPKFPQL